MELGAIATGRLTVRPIRLKERNNAEMDLVQPGGFGRPGLGGSRLHERSDGVHGNSGLRLLAIHFCSCRISKGSKARDNLRSEALALDSGKGES
jgi:hypothetical protein